MLARILYIFLFLAFVEITYGGECNDSVNEGYVCCACVCCIGCNLESAVFDDCSYQSDTGSNGQGTATGNSGEYVSGTYEQVTYEYHLGDGQTCSSAFQIAYSSSRTDHCSSKSPCDEPTCRGNCAADKTCNFFWYSQYTGVCKLFTACDAITETGEKGVTYEKEVELVQQPIGKIQCTLIAHDILRQVYYNEKQLPLTQDKQSGYYGFSYEPVYDASFAVHAEVIKKKYPAAIQMTCDDGFTTHKDWMGVSDNVGATSPEYKGIQWFENEFDTTYRMKKVCRDYDGKDFYKTSTFDEQLSLSSESIWPCEGKQWAWFNFKPYRSNGVRRMLHGPMSRTRMDRRYLADTNEAVPDTDMTINNVTIPHAWAPGTFLYKVRTRWHMYGNNGTEKLFDYDTTVPNIVYEHYRGCQTKQEFLTKYATFCFTDVCTHSVEGVQTGFENKGIDQICVLLSDYDGQEIILDETLEKIQEQSSDEVSESKYYTAVAFAVVFAVLFTGVGTYAVCYRGNSEDGMDGHFNKL